MSFGDTLIEEDGFGFVPRPPGTTLEKSREIVRRYCKIVVNYVEEAATSLVLFGISDNKFRPGKNLDILRKLREMRNFFVLLNLHRELLMLHIY